MRPAELLRDPRAWLTEQLRDPIAWLAELVHDPIAWIARDECEGRPYQESLVPVRQAQAEIDAWLGAATARARSNSRRSIDDDGDGWARQRLLPPSPGANLMNVVLRGRPPRHADLWSDGRGYAKAVLYGWAPRGWPLLARAPYILTALGLLILSVNGLAGMALSGLAVRLLWAGIVLVSVLTTALTCCLGRTPTARPRPDHDPRRATRFDPRVLAGRYGRIFVGEDQGMSRELSDWLVVFPGVASITVKYVYRHRASIEVKSLAMRGQYVTRDVIDNDAAQLLAVALDERWSAAHQGRSLLDALEETLQRPEPSPVDLSSLRSAFPSAPVNRDMDGTITVALPDGRELRLAEDDGRVELTDPLGTRMVAPDHARLVVLLRFVRACVDRSAVQPRAARLKVRDELDREVWRAGRVTESEGACRRRVYRRFATQEEIARLGDFAPSETQVIVAAWRWIARGADGDDFWRVVAEETSLMPIDAWQRTDCDRFGTLHLRRREDCLDGRLILPGIGQTGTMRVAGRRSAAVAWAILSQADDLVEGADASVRDDIEDAIARAMSEIGQRCWAPAHAPLERLVDEVRALDAAAIDRTTLPSLLRRI